MMGYDVNHIEILNNVVPYKYTEYNTIWGSETNLLLSIVNEHVNVG